MNGRGNTQFIIGPVLEDLVDVGLDGHNLDIATAYYTAGALRTLRDARPRRLRFMCRIDLQSTAEWVQGSIDPAALYQLLSHYIDQGVRVNLFGHPDAHAKFYIGHRCALVGSANLTTKGFGGGAEVLWRLHSAAQLRTARRSAGRYASLLRPIDLAELRAYVEQHREEVAQARRTARRERDDQERLPAYSRDRHVRFGDYRDFQRFLAASDDPAAQVILERAQGRSNLQGHIHRNFYGLRQFLLAYPQHKRRFETESPARYQLSRDADIELDLSNFVTRQAVDEDDFSLDTWRTYLPRECGGRAGRHGGTIGNLNRMLPLVARYLAAAPRRR